MSFDQNFPLTNAKIVNPDGSPTLLFLSWMRSIFDRTGGAVGVSSDELELLTVLAQGQSGQRDPKARDLANAAALQALFQPTRKVDLTQALMFALAQVRSPSRPASSGLVFPASQAIAAGDLVNVYVTGGVMTVRKADASDTTKFCNGFSLTGIANAATGPVQFFGFNDKVTVSTGASEVWLSDVTPGAFTTTAPTTSGHLLQTVGTAVLGLGLAFVQGSYVIL